MSRTYRQDPRGCWMRSPRHRRARIAASVLADPELAEVVNRQPKRVSQPPDACDDLLVSYWRGQAWARRDRIRG